MDGNTGEAMKRSRKTCKAILAVLFVGIVISAGSRAFAEGGGGNYLLPASNLGYDNMTAAGVIGLSDMTPNRTVNISMGGKGLLTEKPVQTTPVLSWETGAGKSYLIPALEIPAFLLLLNGYDRLAYPNAVEPDGKKTYSTNLSTTWDHIVNGHWVIDRDPFAMNQFNHPYQGAIFHGFARSAGLSYWEALLYDNIGSYLWKMGGETGDPSLNDQITTGQAGSFLGEALFRMANLVLEGDGEKPGFWRELGAAALSPSMGFNRYTFDDRFKPIFPSHNPATFWRVRLGASLSENLTDRGGANALNRKEATADFIMAYGLPGKPGYSYSRPFDYFHFELSSLGTLDNPVDNIMIRGLLLGKDYEAGNAYRGIWGLYGGYDYISPHIFRVSSTSLSLGTTFQWWLSRAVALQGSVLGGVGYAAAGNVAAVGERDYHYGFAPQGLLALRLILGDRAMLDLTGRAYYVTGSGGDNPGGRENVDRLNMGFTVRLFGRHALGLQYIASIRDAHYPDRAWQHPVRCCRVARRRQPLNREERGSPCAVKNTRKHCHIRSTYKTWPQRSGRHGIVYNNSDTLSLCVV
jgi:hypothetical protein